MADEASRCLTIMNMIIATLHQISVVPDNIFHCAQYNGTVIHLEHPLTTNQFIGTYSANESCHDLSWPSLCLLCLLRLGKTWLTS